MAVKSLITFVLVVTSYTGLAQVFFNPFASAPFMSITADTSNKITVSVYDSLNNTIFKWQDGGKMEIKDTAGTIKVLLKLLINCQENLSRPRNTSFRYASIIEEDTLTADRFIEDSLGNGYEIEYRYSTHWGSPNAVEGGDAGEEHGHWIALVNIIQFKGNKQHTIAKDIKAVYSPVECVSDNRELWLKRLYEIQNKK